MSRIVVTTGAAEGAPAVSAKLVGGVVISRWAGIVVLTASDSTGGIGVVGVAVSGKVAGGSVACGRLVLGRVGKAVVGGTRTGMTPSAAARKHSCG